MITFNLKKYEINFLVYTSLMVTLLNNLPYYSLFFTSSPQFPRPNLTVLEITYNIVWYTLQCLVSILLISFFNYYWKKYVLPKNAKLWLLIPLVTIYNVLISYALLKASMWIAGHTVGYPFGEDFAWKYYFWKYIYLTPSAVLLAYVLQLIIRKRLVERNNTRLIEENLSVQLNTLKDQIKPHFLFNTLNTLSAVIRNENKEEGLKYVDDLANVYRYILEKSNHNLVELSVEMGFAQSYIRLLKKRFNQKFDVEIDLPNKYQTYKIPPLTLQLLIENAIKHNELTDASPVMISIYIDLKHIVVANTIQTKASDSSGLRIGLQNLNMRYKILMEEEIQISKADNKFIVKLPLLEKPKK